MYIPLFNRENIKKYVPRKLKASVRSLSSRFNIGRLPQHPYQAQFDPEMDCPETDWAKRFFLIASTPRCGSHYLGHMLGETGECGVPLEYLNAGNLRHWARRFRTFRLDVLFSKFVQHRTSANGTFTLKAHWHQYEPHIESLDGLTLGLGFEKIVWISRRNQLSQAISTVIAQQTGVWISGAKPVGEAHFDYDAIVKVANSTRHANLQWRDQINTLAPERSMTLVYEDLLSDDAVRKNVQEFFGLKTKLKPSDRTKKQTNEINILWKKRFTEEVRDEDRWILDLPEWLT